MHDLLTSLTASLQALSLLLAAPAAAPVVTPSIATSTPAVQEAPASFTTINRLYKDAVFNVLCKGTGKVKSGTASGVIISPNGLALVNAHIAQYMLLEQFTNAKITCTIRTGSPAKASYKAEVLYIPPTWINTNGSQIAKKVQKGTGAHDYALIHISKPLKEGATLPEGFPFISPNPSLRAVDNFQRLLVRAYPAELLSASSIRDNLFATATIAQVAEIATFAANASEGEPTPDLLSLGGVIVAQGGSSGGAVVTQAGKLTGLIVTSTRRATTAERNLAAITLSHINESLHDHTTMSLAKVIDTPLKELKETFHDSLVDSVEHLVDALND